MNSSVDPARRARLARRHAAEWRFRAIGMLAVAMSVLVLGFLLVTMSANALEGFRRSELRFPVDLSGNVLQVQAEQLNRETGLALLQSAGLPDVVRFSAEKSLGSAAAAQLGDDAWREVGKRLIADPALLGKRFDVSVAVGQQLASGARGDARPEINALAAKLTKDGSLIRSFDPGFFSRSDATDPQAVGIWGAQLGAPAVWLLPVMFPMVMALGGFLGLIGVPVPGVEVGIAVSALVLGMAILLQWRPPLAAALFVVCVFAIFHGHAHGTELPPGESGLLYSMGFVAATGYVTLAERPLDPKDYPTLSGDALKPSAGVFVGADQPGDGASRNGG